LITPVSGVVVTGVAPGASTGLRPVEGAAQGPSFDQVLGQIFNNVVDTVRNGETAAVQGLQGNMAPMDVVEAVMSAQRTLQATLAIRDKAVSAFQEISRMAI
jgi:flagellar hook-basal body complex protein FliE